MRLGTAATFAAALLAGALLDAQVDPDRVIPGGGILVKGWTGKIDAGSVRQGRTINDARFAQAFLLELGVTHGQDLVDQKDFGLEVGGNRKRQPHVHPAGITLHRCVQESLDLGERHDFVELAGNLAARRQWRMVQGFNEPGKADQRRSAPHLPSGRHLRR